MKQQTHHLVSVVIPAYNAQSYVEESINSIIKQTYDNLEILIIDDKSSDGTLEIAQRMAANDARIRIIANQKNMGIGANRSIGIAESKGEYICWQDADDIAMRDRVEVQAKYLDEHPSVGIVGGYITFFNDESEGKTRRYAEDDTSLRSKIFRYTAVAQPAAMCRKQCYEDVGGYNPELQVAEDLEMLFRIGEKYRFANVQKVVLRYRQSPGSLTQANLRKMELMTLKIRQIYKNNKSYRYTLVDSIYNALQLVTMGVPYQLRLKIFQLIRGDK